MRSFTILQALRLFLCSALFFLSSSAQDERKKQCKQPKIYDALKAHETDGSDSFCSELIASISYIGTLRDNPTLFFYATVTDSKSIDTVYKYKATTTKEVVVSTSFSSQKRTPLSFTKPLPSYVQQYPTPSVIAACSCYIGAGPTYLQYRPCERAVTDTTYSTTFTYTVGKPGPVTSTFTDTITKTRLKHTTAAYPSTCPGADNIDYVGSDRSLWERGCKTGLNQYRDLGTVKAQSLNDCIEKCIEYNVKLGYKQCQAVVYDPRDNGCQRINEPGYFAHPDGLVNVATMRFVPPTGVETDYCATVSGATRLF